MEQETKRKKEKVTDERKMQVVITEEAGEKIVSEKISPIKRHLGIIALEQNGGGTRFTVDVLQVSHLRYHYDPKTQTLEVQFLSLKKEHKERKVKQNENHERRF